MTGGNQFRRGEAAGTEDMGGDLSRRDLLKIGGIAGLGAAVTIAGVQPAQAARVKTSARIVIVGGGAAGLTAANYLVRQLDGAEIFVVDGRKAHLYQPGFTLVAAGLKPSNYVVSST